ncbi:hypothetical protein GGI10_000144 [Coemansia sp. RSA 2530]|nr:hypothetical protein GGI06_001267 [Coemansia sp. S85]KAJ2417483.1 hypothetical protein GGI10_000144 [Coemansia sp. RSA 2530]
MILVSRIVFAVACLGVASAQLKVADDKVVKYPSYVLVKRGAFIVELESGNTSPSTAAYAASFNSINNVRVSSQFNSLFRGLAVSTGNNISAAQLASVQGVKRVWPVRYHTLPYRMSATNITYPYLHTQTGVSRALQELQLNGTGIKVGIVDTGVDYTHPELGNCWKTAGCPWQYGADFIGDKFDWSAPNPIVSPNPTPMDCDGHGTHVSGILSGQGPTVYGVAPGATYGMYRVFSCPFNGSVASTDDIILRGIEAAYQDGHDIISLSLGGGSWPEDPISAACSELVKKGVVVVAANGNEGSNGLYTAGTPAVGHGVIAVGSIDNWNITGAVAEFTTPQSNLTVLLSSPGSDKYPFIFETDVPVVAPTDKNGTALGCTGYGASLVGKVAVIQRGVCSFTQKATAAQSAGAIGVIIYNNVPGIVNPSIGVSVTIPVVAIAQEGAQTLVADISKGPSTVKAPSKLTGTFPAFTGGKMSPFSSFGPSPELAIEPLLSAPGGDIWSTYPQKLGSYASLSGTSMATPYVSGTVALLKQARPQLGVKEIRSLLANSAKPLQDVATGQMIHPYWSGAGLVNVYDAIKSRAMISPPELSINETTWGPVPGFNQLQSLGSVRWAQRNVTIANTDSSKGMDVWLDSSVADSLSMYLANGEIGDVPRTWPASPASVSSDTLPLVAVADSHLHVAAGQSKNITVLVVAPPGLKESEKWFYGGYLNFTLKWDQELVTSSLIVPYAGYNGDFRAADVLSTPDSGLPALTDSNQVAIADVSKLVVSANNTALILYRLDVPSRIVSATLVDTSNNTIGYLPYGYYEYNPRNLPYGDNPLSGATISNVVFTDKEAAHPIKVTAGKYHVHLAALRPLGDANNSKDYQTWDSDQFSIA